MSALPALNGQYRPNLIDSFWRRQWPTGSGVAGLTARLALALFSAAMFSWFARQSIRGGRLGRSRGILHAQRQLAFQIGDLLAGVGDFLGRVGEFLFFAGEAFGLLADLFFELLTKLIDLLTQPLVFALECLPIRSWALARG
jgi:hypothetical protein